MKKAKKIINDPKAVVPELLEGLAEAYLVASAPPERIEDRRGIAGDLFVIKIADGVSATINDLEGEGNPP